MNKKIQKILSITLPMFLATNNLSSAMESLPMFLATNNFSSAMESLKWLEYFMNSHFSLTLDSYINKNLVYSPLSLNAALIMAANGTSNSTVRTNVANYMGFQSLEEANNWLSNIMSTKIDGVNIASSMWLNEDLLKYPDDYSYYDGRAKFEKIIIDKLKAGYGFINDTDGHNVINNWISQKTNGKISKILDKVDPSTLLVLVSTIYFNSKFVEEFENKGSIRFKGINKKTNNVPTIKDQDGGSRNCYYCATSNYQAIRIPFEKNGCYLYMVLPKTNDKFDEVKNIDVKELIKIMELKNVHVEIPRIKMESLLDLHDYCNSNDLLHALVDAELNNIYKAKIGKIVQKVVFEITPEGVEAAAASACEMEDEKFVVPIKPEVKVIFDHAFIGFITDKDNNVLFKFNVKDIDGVERVNLNTGECTKYESKDSDDGESELRAVVKTDA